MTSLTSQLASAVALTARRPLPDAVVSAARRSLLNVLGTTIGACRTDAVDAVVTAGLRHGAPGACQVPGRPERLDLYSAALAIGVSGHLDDFDDTHLRTVIHPGAACLAVIVPITQSEGVGDPARALIAFALGCEVQLRLGNAVSPSHYDLGWHITGTCGVVGAAVSASIMWGLSEEETAAAIGLAIDATVGHREAFGSMAKSFHPGKAAEQGLLAAALAKAGRRPLDGQIEGPGGFFGVLSESSDSDELTGDFGARWELELNAFKPYPCGIVSHPVIDAALAASARVPDVTAITAISIRCNPLVPELMGNMDPHDGLQGRFSAAHTAAAALADHELGLDQFDDARVRKDDLVRLRGLITFAVDATCRRDEADIEVTLADGTVVAEHVEHARGSLERPLTDDELRAKVSRLVDRTLPGHHDRIWDAGLRVPTDGLAAVLAELTEATASTARTHTQEVSA